MIFCQYFVLRVDIIFNVKKWDGWLSVGQFESGSNHIYIMWQQPSICMYQSSKHSESSQSIFFSGDAFLVSKKKKKTLYSSDKRNKLLQSRRFDIFSPYNEKFVILQII
eukprot:TRINITY_DN10148_c0_g1_i3.p3 TRINITY_DN10148_c0_g1~~TRINITY_DN10148_c0_g1_i3.p3  ORF type:complete len:109 (-),score=2.80 TRINITY_DN10148_c0_g1_i3:134-460(-)